MTDASVAFSDPDTRVAWRKATLKSVGALLLGIVVFGVFVVTANIVEGRSQYVIDNGQKVTATVVTPACPNHPLKNPASANLVLRYTVDGVTKVGNLTVDGCGPDYRVGDKVEIYIDPRNPQHFVTTWSDNQSPWTTWPMIAALLGGVLLIAFSIPYIVKLVRIRWLLRKAPWTPQDAFVYERISYWRRGSNQILVLGDGDARIVYRCLGTPVHVIAPDDHAQVLIATTERGRSAVFGAGVRYPQRIKLVGPGGKRDNFLRAADDAQTWGSRPSGSSQPDANE
jgi:hypothetical protein